MDPLLVVFFIASGGMIFLLVLGSLAYHSPERKKKLEDLLKKQEDLKKALLELSIKQVFALNGMLQCGQISPENYYIELSRVYKQCTDAGIDISVLKKIDLPAYIANKDKLKKDILNTSSTLFETNNMSIDEFNEIIDKTLDNK